MLALVAPGMAANPTAVAAEEGTEAVTLVLFHGEGCPHCAEERAFLAGLATRYPDLVIEQHEVWYDQANRALLRATADRLGFEASGVPVTVIGDRVWIGFGDGTATEIEAAVADALAPASVTGQPVTPGTDVVSVDVPLVGQVDLSSASLLASTVVIGFVDGVNPCSLWVLTLLLAMVLNRGSRGRVLLVGSVFLAVTAGMYAIYVIGMYSALDYAAGLGWIRLLVAAIALVFGVLQLMDGIRPGTGPSLSISPSRRPALYAGMRGVAAEDRGLVATLAGTVVLAVGVSLLETPCTAGLPLLWTSMLADRGVSTAAAVALFAVYMAVFLIDELIVFAVAAVALRQTRLQQRHGRLLKLVAGSFLVTLALTMLLLPEALDSLAGTIAVMGVAGLMAGVLWLTTTALDSRAARHDNERSPKRAREGR